MSIGVNLDEGYLIRLGVDPNILMVALIGFIITGLIVHRHLAIIVLTVMMSLGANVSAATAAQVGYDPDFMFAGLIALIFFSFVARQLGMS